MFLDFLQEGTTFVQWFQVPKSYLLLLMGVVTAAIVLVHYLVGSLKTHDNHLLSHRNFHTLATSLESSGMEPSITIFSHRPLIW